MNERIRQLAIETDAWCDENWLGHVMYNHKWEEHFAELIVRECATLAYDGPSGILDHFGVEE